MPDPMTPEREAEIREHAARIKGGLLTRTGPMLNDLLAELDRLRGDAARLDWLMENFMSVGDGYNADGMVPGLVGGTHVCVTLTGWQFQPVPRDLSDLTRAAIDRARSTPGGGDHG
jgi:hypothetical protein